MIQSQTPRPRPLLIDFKAYEYQLPFDVVETELKEVNRGTVDLHNPVQCDWWFRFQKYCAMNHIEIHTSTHYSAEPENPDFL